LAISTTATSYSSSIGVVSDGERMETGKRKRGGKTRSRKGEEGTRELLQKLRERRRFLLIVGGEGGVILRERSAAAPAKMRLRGGERRPHICK